MRIYFDYVPEKLSDRGLYHPCHRIYIPQLYGKAEVFDESNTPIKTPNTYESFGYIEITDLNEEVKIKNLFDKKLKAFGVDVMTEQQARKMLEDNGYVDDGVNGYLLVEASEDMDILQEAVYLNI